MIRYYNVNTVYFNGFSNASVAANIVNMDCNNVSFHNGDMSMIFNGCTNLTSVTNISNSIVNAYASFQNCSNLVNMPSLPATVTNTRLTFANCKNLSNITEMPANTTDMYATFKNTAITISPSIPDSVEMLYACFLNCYNLSEMPTIPNNVKNMSMAFQSTNISSTTNIPNSVTSIFSAFSNCQNLTGNINIQSKNIAYTSGIFNYTSKAKDVYIPYKYNEPCIIPNKKEPNVNKVGNPIINNGVVSGFSSNDYLVLPNAFNPGSSTWEIVFKATLGTTSADQSICGNYGGSYQNAPQIFLNSNNILEMWIPNNPISSTPLISKAGTHTLTNGNTYWFKLYFTGTAYKLDYSTDGITYINDILENNSTTIGTATSGFPIGFNYWASSSTQYWRGSIDLNSSYIKVGDTIWWNGNKDVPSYNINGTITGTLTDNLSVISGFSASNYLLLDKQFTPGNSTWEYYVKFTTGSVSGAQGIVGCLGTSDNCTPFYINSSSKLVAYLSSNGASWDLANAVIIMNLSSNTTYKMKAEFTGTAYKWYLYENDAWVLKYTLNSTTKVYGNLYPIFGNNRGTSNPFLGSIDLSECYITINGKVWWEGLTYKNSATYDSFKTTYPIEVNGTITGTLTNNDGIVNGFDSNNYITLPITFNPGNDIWEVSAKFKSGTYINSISLFNGAADQRGFRLGTTGTDVTTAGKFQLLVSNGSSWINTSNHYGSYTILPNTTYWVKAGYNGTNYYLKYSLDGINYILDVSYASSTKIASYNNERISLAHSDAEIDLNETYIQINSELLWKGTNNIFKTNRPTNIINGKIVGILNNSNGVVDSFSSNSYIVSDFFDSSEDFEIYVKCKRTTNKSSYGSALMTPTGVYIGYTNAGYFHANIGNGSTWETGVTGSSMNLNTTYFMKFTKVGTTFTLYTSTNGTTWTSQGSFTSSKVYRGQLYIGRDDSNNDVFMGEIDLNECYIKRNNTIIWKGITKASDNYYRDATKGYTAYGTICDNGYIFKNFSNSNYLTPSVAFPLNSTNNSWEIASQITYQVKDSSQTIWSQGARYPTILRVEGDKIELDISNGSGEAIGSIISTTSLIPGTTYYIKSEFIGTAYNLYMSTDNENWNLEGTINSSLKVESRGVHGIGINLNDSGNTLTFNGEMDLSYWYAKANGEIIWKAVDFKNNGVLFYELKNQGEVDTTGYEYILQDGILTLTKFKGIPTLIPWVQPILTSGTSYGVCTDSRNNAGESQEGWRALDGNTSTHFTPTNSAGQWWKWVVPDTLHFEADISTMTIRGGEPNTSTFMAYADENRTIPLVDTEFTIPTDGNTTTVTITHTVDTNTIYLYKTASSSWSGISTLTFNNVYTVTYDDTETVIPGI